MTEQEIRRAFDAGRLPGGTAKAIQGRLEAELGKPLSELTVRIERRRRVWPQLLRAAAVLLLLVGVGTFLLWPLLRRPVEQITTAEPLDAAEPAETAEPLDAEEPAETAEPSDEVSPLKWSDCIQMQYLGDAGHNRYGETFGNYSYELYDLDGEYVGNFGVYIWLKIYVLEPGNRLIVISGADGDRLTDKWRCYYDPADGTLSEKYYHVLYESDEMILCGEYDRVAAREPLSGRLLCELTEFSEPFSPVRYSPFFSVREENGIFTVVYYATGFRLVGDRFVMSRSADDGSLRLDLIHRQDLTGSAGSGAEALPDEGENEEWE